MTDYDAEHRRQRANWQQLIDLTADNGNPTLCRRCHQPIPPHDPQAWDLGHHTDLTLGGKGSPRTPEHARCNRQAGQTLTTTTPPSRNW